MPYQKAKVYNDGSHFIAMPPENFPRPKRRYKPKSKREESPDSPKAKFETAYSESQSLPKRERKKYIKEKLQDAFPNEEREKEFIESNIERKKINAAKRRVRLMRKVYLQEWNYFVTFTFSGELHTEETFKEKLRNTLKHMVSRKGWKYIGVWERSPEKQRLHFHGIFYIPPNAMIGELVEAIEREKLDKSLDEHENTFLIVRSTELIAELKKKYEVRGYKVIPVYIYSDKKTIAEAYATKYQDVDSAMSDASVSLPDRTERLQKADSDYENAMAEASNIYDEVLIYSEKDAVGSASMRTKLYGLIKKYNDVLETNSIFVIHSYRNINDANSLFETIKSSAEEYLGQPKPMVDSLLYGTGSYLISETVYEAIEKSDFIICDISSDRCNDCKKPEALTQGVRSGRAHV